VAINCIVVTGAESKPEMALKGKMAIIEITKSWEKQDN
jgi:hypothetical protein